MNVATSLYAGQESFYNEVFLHLHYIQAAGIMSETWRFKNLSVTVKDTILLPAFKNI